MRAVVRVNKTQTEDAQLSRAGSDCAGNNVGLQKSRRRAYKENRVKRYLASYSRTCRKLTLSRPYASVRLLSETLQYSFTILRCTVQYIDNNIASGTKRDDNGPR